MSDRAHDVVLYGATGFTGRQAAAWFAEHVGTRLRWAIGGRSRSRLEAVAAILDPAPPVVVADAHDEAAIDALAASTRVVLTTAGPYARYGDALVAACARHGTHYVDITGETAWARRMIDRHHETARASGARIVPFCGFDSIPSDIGAWMMVRHLRERGLGTRRVVTAFKMRGGLNGGTLASALTMAASEDGRTMRDPFLLDPVRASREQRQAHRDPMAAWYEASLGTWMAPFVMGAINTRVVRRSAALEAAWGAPHGEAFSYGEGMAIGGSWAPLRARATAFGLGLAMGSLAFAPIRALAERFGPDPGEGPSDAAIEGGFFRCRYAAEGEDGRLAFGEMFGEGDPGNRNTVIMLCSAALTLAEDGPRLPGGPERAGVLTPATALGEPLADRLREAGLRVRGLEKAD